jgi:NADH-quinone oxidoreductase subunit J
MDEAGVVIAFWAFSALTIGSALAVAIVRSLMHAVIALIGSFVGLAGLYVTLSADFIAVAQVLIYVGAISILFLFAIVLTPRGSRDNAGGFLRWPALVIGLLTGAALAFVAIDTEWRVSSGDGFEETAADIGELLLDKYVLPFEIASVLLLVAILGAILLVRPEATEEDSSVG